MDNLNRILSYLAIAIITLTPLETLAQLPKWSWSNTAVGTQSESSTAVATDSNGNVYMTGLFSSPVLKFGSTILINNSDSGGTDIFIVKYGINGNVLWAKSAGGHGNEYSNSISVDKSGHVYVTGRFSSISMKLGSVDLVNEVGDDLFIIKYTADGDAIWARAVGGDRPDEGSGITNDPDGNVYITGSFQSSSITFGSFTLNNIMGSPNPDIFVAKYDPNGNVIWAKSAGKSGPDESRGIACDNNGNVYITGYFYNTIIFGNHTLFSEGFRDIFVVRYNPQGTVEWAKAAGGSSYDEGNSIAVNNNGDILITGVFYSPTVTFENETLSNIREGHSDIFTAKFDSTGNVKWARSVGGEAWDDGEAICTDKSGNVFVSGSFSSTYMKADFTTLFNGKASYHDLFVVKYNDNGDLIWATREGGNEIEQCLAITTGKFGDLYIAGNFNSPSVLFSKNSLKNSGEYDVLIAKLIVGDTTNTSVTLEQNCHDLEVKVFPNPAQDYIGFSTLIYDETPLIISIEDLVGRTVITKNFGSNPIGLLQGSLLILNIPTGNYTIRFNHNNTIQTKLLSISR